MKKLIKLALIAAFAAVVFIPYLRSPQTVRAASAADHQRTLYQKHCAVCHGSNGRANTPKGRELEAADLTSPDVKAKGAARIARAIKNGRPGMPAFGKKLTPAQIASLARYVRGM